MNNIKFFTQHEQLKETLPPVPASKFWPQWFKDQSTSFSDGTANREGINTVKSCPAMLDVLNMGYIIPLWTDFKLMRTPDNTNIQWLSPNPQMFPITTHPEEQIDAYPFGPNTFKGTVKLINPWQVRTAPGYSCMFVSPYFFVCVCYVCVVRLVLFIFFSFFLSSCCYGYFAHFSCHIF